MLGSFTLGQALSLLAPVADPRQTQRQDLFGHGQTGLGMPHGRRTSQHLEILLALILQSLPAISLLGQALHDTLLQPFQTLRLALLLGLQGFNGLGIDLKIVISIGGQIDHFAAG